MLIVAGRSGKNGRKEQDRAPEHEGLGMMGHRLLFQHIDLNLGGQKILFQEITLPSN